MSIIDQLPNGQYQINKVGAFCGLLENRLPDLDQKITDILDDFDRKIHNLGPNITTGALSNSHGDWYEWLLAISAWNFYIDNPNSFLMLSLPNVRSFDVAELYTEDLSELIHDLKLKVSRNTTVQLISSNPDFVILRPSNQLIGEIEIDHIDEFDHEDINRIDSFYQNFIGKCGFDDVIGYLSVKTSLRPDRRLQIPHEGSLMKAIYTHLQTRKWIINPPGLKYYAFATKITDSDKLALKTVATHSITTVHSLPQAAVDEVFEVNTLSDAHRAYNQILL